MTIKFFDCKTNNYSVFKLDGIGGIVPTKLFVRTSLKIVQ
jgi:hypothetical protein